MGVKGLSAEIRDWNLIEQTLKNVTGKTVIVDVANLMYMSLHSKLGSDQYFCQPPVALTAQAIKVKHFIALTRKCNIEKVILVFDGKYAPNKAGTHKARYNISDTAVAQVVAMMASPDQQDLKELAKKQYAGVRPREDGLFEVLAWAKKQADIVLVGAPYEADHQIAFLAHHIDNSVVYGEDSDFFALRVPLLLQHLKVTSREGKCNLFTHEEGLLRLDTRNNFNGKLRAACNDDPEVLLILSTWLGTDYVEHPYGMGKSATMKLMARYLNGETVEEINNGIAKKYDDKAYHKKFLYNFNQFKYAPLFLPPHEEGDGIVYLGALNPLPTCGFQSTKNLSRQNIKAFKAEWKTLLGWDPVIAFEKDGSLLALQDFYSMTSWSRTLAPAKAMSKYSGNDFGADGRAGGMPSGSVIDFEKNQPHNISTSMLFDWLAWRSIILPSSTTSRSALLAHVAKVRALIANGDVLTILPTSQLAGNSQYWSYEVLEALEGENFAWETASLLDFIRDSVVPITPQTIDTEFGAERNGVRQRACLRFISGHFDLATFEYSDARTIDDSHQKVKLIHIKCTPSMKAKVYYVSMVFKLKEVGGLTYILDRSLSSCDCPNGRYFCSHMLAFLMVFILIQKYPAWTMHELALFMPPPIKSLYSLGIPAVYVYNRLRLLEEIRVKREVKKIKKKKKKKKKQKKMNQMMILQMMILQVTMMMTMTMTTMMAVSNKTRERKQSSRSKTF